MKKFKMVLALTMAAILLVCTACSANSTPAPSSEAASTPESSASSAPESSAAPSNLLVSVWAGPHADLQKTIGQEYPSGTITIDDVDYGNLKQKQLTSFQAASGSGNYDVVWVNSQWMKEYVEAGYILPMDDYIKEAGIDTSMYSKGLLEGCQFDGKTYGLPTYAQCLILAYDSAVFDKEGVKVPTTADELVETAKYFKSKGTGIALPAKQGSGAVTLFSQLLYSDDGAYLDASGKPALTGDKAVYAASIYDQLVQNSIDGCLAWHHDEVAEAVRTKAAPIGIIMSGLANQNSDPDKSMIVDTVKYAPLAGKGGKAAASNSFWVWAIAKNSSDPAGAFKYCSWMTSPEIEKKQTLADSQISAITSLSQDAEVAAKAPYLSVVMEELGNGKTDPMLTSFATLKEKLIVSLSEIASTDADPVKVLGKLQDDLKDVDFSK